MKSKQKKSVAVAESTLGASPQARKEEDVSKEKATATTEEQSPQEKMTEETNNTVAEVDKSMPQETEKNSKTFVDETTLGVEDKEVVAERPEEVDSDSDSKIEMCNTPSKA